MNKRSVFFQEDLCAECCLSNHPGHQVKTHFNFRENMRQTVDSESEVLKRRIVELRDMGRIIHEELKSAQELSEVIMRYFSVSK
jgi:hypothetical protein